MQGVHQGGREQSRERFQINITYQGRHTRRHLRVICATARCGRWCCRGAWSGCQDMVAASLCRGLLLPSTFMPLRSSILFIGIRSILFIGIRIPINNICQPCHRAISDLSAVSSNHAPTRATLEISLADSSYGSDRLEVHRCVRGSDSRGLFCDIIALQSLMI